MKNNITLLLSRIFFLLSFKKKMKTKDKLEIIKKLIKNCMETNNPRNLSSKLKIKKKIKSTINVVITKYLNLIIFPTNKNGIAPAIINICGANLKNRK